MPKISVFSKKGAKRAGNPWLWNHLSEKLWKTLILTTICTLSLVSIINKILKPNRNFKMSILSNIEPFRSKIEAKKLLLCPPKKREKRHMLCYVTSLQRCLFENILAIYITCTNTYYKSNTDFCYTVIIIKNNQNCQK